jgi:hypothetical protein
MTPEKKPRNGESNMADYTFQATYLYAKTGQENMQARVIQLIDGSFSVTLWDLDCGEVIPYVSIFNTLEEATAHANQIVKG